MTQATKTLQEHGRLIQAIETGTKHFLLRWHLPEISQQAVPGTLIQFQPNNRSHPVFRSSPKQGWIEVLINGASPQSDLTEQEVSADLSQTFELIEERPKMLLIGEESGIAAIVFLAEQLKIQKKITLLILLGFNNELPFRPQPSRIMTPDLPAHVIASMPLLEDWNMPCRIADMKSSPGCFDEGLTELAEHWLKQQDSLDQISIHVCAHDAVCDGIMQLAKKFSILCQTIKLN